MSALCVAIFAMVQAVSAADVPDTTMHGVASGETLKIGFETSGKHVLPQTVYLHGGLTRLEFQSANQQGYLLRNGKAVWLIDAKDQRAWPLKYTTSARQYIYDPADPCRDMGFSCERDGAKVIAGRNTTGWRYRHAGSSGPDGSDNGTMWIDDEYGLLLGYHAADMEGRAMDWIVTSVSFDPLPADLFELPKGP